MVPFCGDIGTTFLTALFILYILAGFYGDILVIRSVNTACNLPKPSGSIHSPFCLFSSFCFSSVFGNSALW